MNFVALTVYACANGSFGLTSCPKAPECEFGRFGVEGVE